MVAVEPGLRYIIELVIGGDNFGGQVAMIVINGHLLSVLVVKNPGGFGLQEKIFGNKFRHYLFPLFWSVSELAILVCSDYLAVGLRVPRR